MIQLTAEIAMFAAERSVFRVTISVLSEPDASATGGTFHGEPVRNSDRIGPFNARSIATRNRAAGEASVTR